MPFNTSVLVFIHLLYLGRLVNSSYSPFQPFPSPPGISSSTKSNHFSSCLSTPEPISHYFVDASNPDRKFDLIWDLVAAASPSLDPRSLLEYKVTSSWLLQLISCTGFWWCTHMHTHTQTSKNTCARVSTSMTFIHSRTDTTSKDDSVDP